MTLTLYRGFPVSTTFTTSPFVSKLELRLRHGGVEHQVDVGTPLKGPRGKVPYVTRSQDETAPPVMLGDSALITNTLIRDGVLEDLNASLSPSQKAQDLALRGLLEDKLYWLHYYEMWMQNYYTMRDWVLWSVPYPVRIVVGLIVWRTVQANLTGQGAGRFTADEVRSFRQEIWEGMEALLAESRRQSPGAKLFWVLGGDKPTEADMSLFGSIVAIVACPAAPEARKLVESLPTVMEYATRIRDTYFENYRLGV